MDFTDEELRMIGMMLQKTDPLNIFEQVQVIKQKVQAQLEKQEQPPPAAS